MLIPGISAVSLQWCRTGFSGSICGSIKFFQRIRNSRSDRIHSSLGCNKVEIFEFSSLHPKAIFCKVLHCLLILEVWKRSWSRFWSWVDLSSRQIQVLANITLIRKNRYLARTGYKPVSSRSTRA